ncbi:hypothetical protein AX16_010510 [Volvariella volvacea WC 439]|nr:hypothetical protein AX16_010510 [Volvariella volvacea WC 439]
MNRDGHASEAAREDVALLPDENLDAGGDEVREKSLLRRLGISFFLFGLINNVLYVIILSAALDLVPPSTPKGIIAFCNIAPSLIVKVGWPYVLKGRIRYARRIVGCCTLSVIGMLVVALFDSLFMRLLGICLASFSSGLGELTFLQLSTTYSPPYVGGHSVGYFASGTGAAGLVGAFIWWEVRGLGVRLGVGLSSIMPFIMPLTYFLLLPRPSAFVGFLPHPTSSDDSTVPYEPLLSSIEGEGEAPTPVPKAKISLSMDEKLRLVRPLLLKYMLPLFSVYLFEYTINQGIAPTLLYPIPDVDEHWILSKVIHSVRDYYPLWQLVYQTTVFLSRSSISIGLPPIPSRLLAIPSIIQFFILLTLAYESAVGFFAYEDSSAIIFVFLLVSMEGICGGLAYVNAYHGINQEPPDPQTAHDEELSKQVREFKIGSVGFADSSGILFASLLAVPTEIGLCKAQVQRGKILCQGL